MIPDRNIKITLTDISGDRKEFTTLRSLYDFAQKERDLWKAHSETIKAKHRVNDATVNSFSYLNNLTTNIEGWLDQLEQWDDNALQQQLNTLHQQVFTPLQQHWLWSGNPSVQPYVQCFLEHNSNVAKAFLDLVIRNKVTMNQNNIDAFNGALLGYEFLNQASDITRRRNGEKAGPTHDRFLSNLYLLSVASRS